MSLMEGHLGDVVAKDQSQQHLRDTVDAVSPQMLQAMDCIHSQGINHRDDKTENIKYILYTSSPTRYQLGDFGASNHAIYAKTQTGSPLFMAPETATKRPKQMCGHFL